MAVMVSVLHLLLSVIVTQMLLLRLSQRHLVQLQEVCFSWGLMDVGL